MIKQNLINRPVTVTGKTSVSRVRKMIESDGKHTIRSTANSVGIAFSRVHFILKSILKVRKISVKWIPHIKTDDQKRVREQPLSKC